jgi:hypothetical protein
MRFPLDIEKRPAGLPLYHTETIPDHNHVRWDRVEAVQGVGGDRRVHEVKFSRV